jgi:hypothetical protein
VAEAERERERERERLQTRPEEFTTSYRVYKSHELPNPYLFTTLTPPWKDIPCPFVLIRSVIDATAAIAASGA